MIKAKGPSSAGHRSGMEQTLPRTCHACDSKLVRKAQLSSDVRLGSGFGAMGGASGGGTIKTDSIVTKARGGGGLNILHGEFRYGSPRRPTKPFSSIHMGVKRPAGNIFWRSSDESVSRNRQERLGPKV